MGYADPAQINSGIHMRLYSRAYIIDDGQRRVVFASVDCGMMSQNLKTSVSKIYLIFYIISAYKDHH